jgi:hypothetical protein
VKYRPRILEAEAAQLREEMSLGGRVGAAGDYLVADESGDILFCPAAVFELMFERCPDGQQKRVKKRDSTKDGYLKTVSNGAKRGDKMRAVLDALAKGGKRPEEIRASCGLRSGTVGSTLQRLLHQDKVQNNGGIWSLKGSAE